MALAGIGTAVTLYPVIKRQNQGVALGFVAGGPLEAAILFAGVVSLLSIVKVRQGLGTRPLDRAAVVTTGASLVSVYHGTVLLRQPLMPCISAILLGS